MSNPQKAKGDQFERDCAKFLSSNTKFRVARRFGAGAAEDRGDLEGLPNMTIQCANWASTANALRDLSLIHI